MKYEFYFCLLFTIAVSFLLGSYTTALVFDIPDKNITITRMLFTISLLVLSTFLTITSRKNKEY